MKSKRLLAIVLSLLMVMTSFGSGGGIAFAVDPDYSLSPSSDVRIHGDEETFALKISNHSEVIKGIEFVVPANQPYTIKSISYGNMALTVANTYEHKTDTNLMGVMSIVDGSYKVAFMSTKDTKFATPLEIHIKVEVNHQNASDHVLTDASLVVNSVRVVNPENKFITPTFVTVKQVLLTKTISDQLNTVVGLVKSLPMANVTTLDHKTLVDLTRTQLTALYTLANGDGNIIDVLLAEQNALVQNLKACEDVILALSQEALSVESDILALPTKEALTLATKATVEGVDSKFTALTVAQQNLIQAATKAKLQDLKQRLALLDSSVLALNSNLSTADGTLNQYPVGTLEGQVSQADRSVYEAAIAAGQEVYGARQNKTYTELQKGIADLQTARSTFLSKVITALVEKKTILNTLITESQALYDGAVEGTAAGQYPTSAKAALLAIISSSKSIQNNSQSTLDAYIDGIQKLNAEKAKFIASVITPLHVAQKTLDAKIFEADSLLATGPYGTALNQYPIAAQSGLRQGIENARLINRLSLDDVNAGVTALVSAMNTFTSQKVTALTIATRDVDALFTTQDKSALSSMVTAALIAATKVKVEALSASNERTGLLANIATAEGLFATPTKIILSGLSSMKAGTSQVLTAKVMNAIDRVLSDKPITWTTSDGNVATVTNGTVAAIAKGNAIIKATVNGTSIEKTMTIAVIEIPDLIVSNIPAGSHYNKSVSVSAYRSGEQITLTENGAMLSSATGSATALITTVGSHTINITSGEGGNVKTAQVVFTIDLVKPVVTIPVVADALNQEVTVPNPSFSDINLNESSKSYTLEKLVSGDYVFVKTVSSGDKVKEAGTYKLVAYCRDKAGNEGRAEEAFTITLDQAVPTISVSGISTINTSAVTPVVALTGGSNQGNYTFVGTISKPDYTVATIQSGTPIAACTLAGEYTIDIKAYNPNNPNQFAQYSKRFTIDLATPVISLTGVETGQKYNANVTPVISISDADGLDSAAALLQSATVTLKRNAVTIPYVKGNSITIEGSYELSVAVKDSANHSATPVSVSFIIDKTKPIITFTTIENGGVYFESKTSTITVNETVKSLTLTDASGNPINLVNSAKTFAKVDGQSTVYTIYAVAEDLAGNVTTQSLYFSIDGLPVIFQVTGLSEGAKVQELPAGIICKAIDGQTEIILSPQFTNANGAAFDSTSGAKKMTLSYVKGGSTYTKIFNFILDSEMPTLNNGAISLNNASKTAHFTGKAGGQITLSIEAQDGVSGIERVYGSIGNLAAVIPFTKGNGNAYTGSFTLGSGNAVDQLIKITAVDKSGNVAVQDLYQVTIDNTAPTVTLSIKPNELPDGANQYYKHTATKFYLSSNDSAAKIYYTLNGGNFNEYTVEFAPVEGQNQLAYYAEDAVGNRSEVKTMTTLYDKTGPAQGTDILPATNAEFAASLITMSGKINAEGGKGSKVILEKSGNIVSSTQVASDHAFSFNAITLSEGINTFTLYAVDQAGNVGQSTAITYMLDTTAPVLAIEQLTDTTYKVTANEALSGNLTAVFNGTAINAGQIAGMVITTPNPASGQNILTVTGSDLLGNTGTGSLSTSYLPPATAQEDVKVTDNATIDIPAGAFASATILTVQTIESEETPEFKTLGAAIRYSFSTDPTSPITLTTYIGLGLTGVGIFHIDDDGTVGEFVPALTVSPIPNTLVTDQPYYDPLTGYLVLKTMEFSAYQMSQDVTAPQITVSTTDFTISSGETSTIAGTVTDADLNAKITSVTLDGVKTNTNISSPFNYNLNLTDGVHVVVVEATDVAGNKSTVEKTYTVDKTVPVINGTVAAAATDQPTGTLQLNLSEAVELKVNGNLVGNASGVTQVAVDLSLGSNNFIVSVKDGFGNTATQTLLITRVAAVSLTATASTPVTTDKVTITGTINVTADLYVNDVKKLSNQTAGNFSITDYPVSLGANILTIKAVDGVGNESTMALTVTRNAAPVVVVPGGGGGGFGGVAVAPGVASPAVVMPVTKQGGVIAFDALGIEMTIPVNAFAGNVDISVSEIQLKGQNIVFENGKTMATQLTQGTTKLELAGKVFEFTATSAFDKPIKISLPFDRSKFNKGQMKKLGVYYLNQASGQWEYVPGEIDFARGTITVELNHFSLYALMTQNKTFADIKGHWAQSVIEDLASRRIISGTSEQTFTPQRSMTRGEFAALIVRALDLKPSETPSTFVDVTSKDWFAGYVMKAKEVGILSGYPGDVFKPNAAVTREEMAVMIMNSYQVTTKLDYKLLYKGDKLSFKDNENISTWSKQAVEGAKTLGIINGKTSGEFDPKTHITRAEVAKMIYALLALQ